MKMGPKSEDELKTVRGMKKFCALTGFTAEQVKAVLKTPAGAKAVVQDRYDPLAFCRAYNAMVNTVSELPKEFASWREFLESRRAKIADVELQEKKGLLGPHSEFKRQAGEAVGYVFNELERMEREEPPALAGRPAIEISERLTARTKTIKKNLSAKFENP